MSTLRIERRSASATCISTRSPAWWPWESLIRLRPSMSISSTRERVARSACGCSSIWPSWRCRWRRLARPVSGSVLASDSSSRERRATSSSTAAAWIAAGGVDQPLDRLGEALGLALRQLLAQRAHEHGLEGGDVAREVRGAAVSRPRAARPARRRARSAPRCSSYGSPLALATAPTMSLISVGQLARDPVGRQLPDLVQRGALDQPHEPRLGQLVPRAVQARERAAEGVMRWRSLMDRFGARRFAHPSADTAASVREPPGASSGEDPGRERA